MKSSLTNETLRELLDSIFEGINEKDLKFKIYDFKELVNELLKVIDNELPRGATYEKVRRLTKEFLVRKGEVL